MDKIIGGHEAEMEALTEFEGSAEARAIAIRFAARDLREAALTLYEIANDIWEPEPPDLFGDVMAAEKARDRALDEIERCRLILSCNMVAGSR